ncbi:MAG: sulfatase-like hydrolase/transferase, partial [Prolixibacteraceae bacterium]
MIKPKSFQLLLLIFVFSVFYIKAEAQNHRPNIVYILADDLGYGDVSCYNENSKIHTPHIDKLAEEGMLFRDAHTSSSVCTPTRYGILTGRYNWRTRLKNSVLWGYSETLIKPKELTVAELLKQAGYKTGFVGKWHLGWNWALKSEDETDVDFSKPVKNGPLSHGFDYSFGFSASLDMPPYVYIE